MVDYISNGLWLNLIVEILFQLLLLVIGIILALWYDGLGQPRIYLELMPTNINTNNRYKGIARFPHVKVWNRPRRLPFLRRVSARRCHGNVRFLTLDGEEVHEKAMPIRWSGNPEPLKYEISPQDGSLKRVVETSLFRASRFIDIPPDSGEAIDIAVRVYSESSAYGWNHESYIHDWQHPEFHLPTGAYIARVTIRSEGQMLAQRNFYMFNPESFDDFDLHENRWQVELVTTLKAQSQKGAED